MSNSEDIRHPLLLLRTPSKKVVENGGGLQSWLLILLEAVYANVYPTVVAYSFGIIARASQAKHSFSNMRDMTTGESQTAPEKVTNVDMASVMV